MLAQVLGSWPTMWDTQMEFWTPNFSLAQHGLLRALEE